ncbi:MAG: hypothetical protein EOM91_20640 [Sphingobacteriia bacterium]|nr:hypothetical protein [Sphingobacteriia bacterium]
MNAPDPGMAYLNGLLEDLFMLKLRDGAQRVGYREDEAEMDPALEAQSSAAGGQAQDEYEEDLFYEARAIVGGVSKATPTVEHLRVLIDRLTGPEMPNGSPF